MRNALPVFQTAYVSDGSHACCSSFLLSEHVITIWLTHFVTQGRSPGPHCSVGCQIRVCLQDERQCLYWDTGSVCSEGVHQEGEWRAYWFENDWKISNTRFVPAASLLIVSTEQSPGRFVALAFQAQVIGFENSRMPWRIVHLRLQKLCLRIQDLYRRPTFASRLALCFLLRFSPLTPSCRE
jgi:hypothetical protein